MEILDQPFDLTARQTVELKKRISDDAIKVMIDSTAALTPSAPAGGVIGIEAPKPSGATPAAGTSEAAIAASIRVGDPRPEFYFYSEDRSAVLGKSGFGAQALSNPNPLVLVDLETKNNDRETVAGGIALGTMDFGADPKAMIAFKAGKIRPRLYRVTPTVNTKPGEYAFIAAEVGPAGMAGASVVHGHFRLSQSRRPKCYADTREPTAASRQGWYI